MWRCRLHFLLCYSLFQAYLLTQGRFLKLTLTDFVDFIAMGGDLINPLQRLDTESNETTFLGGLGAGADCQKYTTLPPFGHGLKK